jgi:hypothetical protein
MENQKQHQQMCKKVVQLTRVVHRLNTIHQENGRGDEQQLERETLLHQEEMALIVNDAQDKICHLQNELCEKDAMIQDLVQQKEHIRQQRGKERRDCDIQLEQHTEQMRRDFQVEVDRISKDYEVLAQETRGFEERERTRGLQLMRQEQESSIQLSTCKKKLQECMAACQSKHEEKHEQLVAAHRDQVNSLMTAQDSYANDLSIQLDLAVRVKLDHESNMRDMEHAFQSNLNETKRESELKISKMLADHLLISQQQRESEARVSDFASQLQSKETELAQYRQLVVDGNQDLNDLQTHSAEALQREHAKQKELRGLLCDRDKVFVHTQKALVEMERRVGHLTKDKISLVEDFKISGQRIASLSSALEEREQEQRALQAKLKGAATSNNEMSHQHRLEMNERNAALQRANDGIRVVNAHLRDWAFIVVGLKKTVIDIREDYGHRVKQEGLVFLFRLKETIRNRFSDANAEAKKRMGEMQMKALKELNAVKCEHARDVTHVVEENQLKYHHKEAEYKLSISDLQSRITALESEVIFITAKGEKDLKENKAHSLKVQQLWEATSSRTSDLERTEQKERGEKIALDCNRKWEHRVQLLQALHIEKITSLTDGIQSRQEMYETSLRQCSEMCIESIQDIIQNQGNKMRISIQTLNTLYQNMLEEHVQELEHKLSVKHLEQQQLLRSQLTSSTKEGSKVQKQLKEMRVEIRRLTSAVANERGKSKRSNDCCVGLRSELHSAREEMKRTLENQSEAIHELQSTHEEKVQTLDANLRLEHQDAEALWTNTKTGLEGDLDSVKGRMADLSKCDKELHKTIQQLQKQIETVMVARTNDRIRLQNNVDKLVDSIQKKEHESLRAQENIRIRYEDQIDKLRDDLKSAHADLVKSQAVIRSMNARIVTRDPADVEKIQLLENELARSKQRVKELTTDMGYYKSELKNREDNFNSRFTATNESSIGALTTFQRPSTTSGRNRHGKENRKNIHSRKGIRRVTTFNKGGPL